MDEKVRLSWSLKAVQAGTALPAGMPLAVPAIAALPVLPSAFSTANAEPRRKADHESSEASATPPGLGMAPKPHEQGLVVKPLQATPALASDAQALSQAPVRISDLAARRQLEPDGPACRAGDAAALDPGQILPTPRTEEDRPGADRQRGQETPLPHCVIEFDPDADDGDVVAHAPVPQTVQVAAKSAGVAPPHARPAGDKPAQPVDAPPAAPAEGVPSANTEQAQATPPPAPTAAEPVLVVTEAARGIGTAVIDPLVPLDSIVFGGDPLPGLDSALAILATAPAPDPVADALAQAGQAPEPWFPLSPGLDPFA
jgi:hypothetical protein